MQNEMPEKSVNNLKFFMRTDYFKIRYEICSQWQGNTLPVFYLSMKSMLLAGNVVDAVSVDIASRKIR